MSADPNREWVRRKSKWHWIVPETEKSLGPSIDGHVKARAAWVGRCGNRWIEIFPRVQVIQNQTDDPRPFKIYRNPRGFPCWYQRFVEAWWAITGKYTLHMAWQDGHDHGTAMEYQRTVVNGGR